MRDSPGRDTNIPATVRLVGQFGGIDDESGVRKIFQDGDEEGGHHIHISGHQPPTLRLDPLAWQRRGLPDDKVQLRVKATPKIRQQGDELSRRRRLAEAPGHGLIHLDVGHAVAQGQLGLPVRPDPKPQMGWTQRNEVVHSAGRLAQAGGPDMHAKRRNAWGDPV